MQEGGFGVGFIVGCLALGLVWIVVALCMCKEHAHEWVINGRVYSTKHATRICGKVGERVTDGQWVNWIKSLWVTHQPRPGYLLHFFILVQDEIDYPRISIVTRSEACKFINETQEPDFARKLIKEFIDV